MSRLRSNASKSQDELYLIKENLQSIMRQIDILIEKSPSDTPIRSTSSQMSQGNIDNFAEAAKGEFSTEDAVETIAWLRENYGRLLSLHQAESTLGAVCLLSMDAYIQKLYRQIKEDVQNGTIPQSSNRLNDAIAALEFVVFLRNLSQANQWAFLYAEEGSILNPSDFDDIDKGRPGRVERTILPKLEHSPSRLRGLVTQQRR